MNITDNMLKDALKQLSELSSKITTNDTILDNSGAREWDFGRGTPVEQKPLESEKPKVGRITKFYVRCWLGVMGAVASIIRPIMLHCLSILHIDPNTIPRDKDLEQLCIDLKANMNTIGGGPVWTGELAGEEDPLELPAVKKALSFITPRKTPKPAMSKPIKKTLSPRRSSPNVKKIKGSTIKKAAKTTRKKK